jgi:hypothetical protein
MALKDLSTALASDQGIDVEFHHPASGEPIGMVWHVLGSDSQDYLDAERKVHNRQVEHGKRTRDFSAGLTHEQQEAARIDKMAVCVKSWKEKAGDGWKPTLEYEPGVELECTTENVRKILKDRGFFWLRAQVQEAMDRPANFLPKRPASLQPQPNSGLNMTSPEKTE